MSTGIHRSRAPTESKPRTRTRWPSWKIQARAPKLAPRLRMFMTTALIGTITEPVMRNSSTRVAVTTRSAAYGRRSLSRAFTSMSSAAIPPTSVSKVGWRVAQLSDELGCFGALRGADRGDVDDGDARRGVGSDGRPRRRRAWPRRPRARRRTRRSSASVSAMTVTGSVPRAGNRSARVRATSRTSEERGRVRASPISKRALRNGTPSRTRTRPRRRRRRRRRGPAPIG